MVNPHIECAYNIPKCHTCCVLGLEVLPGGLQGVHLHDRESAGGEGGDGGAPGGLAGRAGQQVPVQGPAADQRGPRLSHHPAAEPEGGDGGTKVSVQPSV